MPARDGDEGDGGRVVADLLDVGAHFLDNLIVALLAVRRLCGVHLVDADDQLLDAQRVGQQGVFAGLPVFGDACFEFPYPSSYNQNGTVSLQGRGREGGSQFAEDDTSTALRSPRSVTWPGDLAAPPCPQCKQLALGLVAKNPG